MNWIKEKAEKLGLKLLQEEDLSAYKSATVNNVGVAHGFVNCIPKLNSKLDEYDYPTGYDCICSTSCKKIIGDGYFSDFWSYGPIINYNEDVCQGYSYDDYCKGYYEANKHKRDSMPHERYIGRRLEDLHDLNSTLLNMLWHLSEYTTFTNSEISTNVKEWVEITKARRLGLTSSNFANPCDLEMIKKIVDGKCKLKPLQVPQGRKRKLKI